MKRFIALIITIITIQCVVPQEVITIEKSQITETINGRKYYLHFVKEGETLFAIARVYNIDVSTIFVHNPSAQEGITPDQLIKIPVVAEPVKFKGFVNLEDSTKFFYHIVKKQETLFGLSRTYGVTVDEIEDLNPHLVDYPRTGQVLKIPKKDKPEDIIEPGDDQIVHIVEKGETLYSLAKRYDVTIGQIKNANPGKTEFIQTGQKLFIPSIEEEVPEDEDEEENKNFIKYTVLQGETLYRIAKNFAINVDTLKAFNSGLTNDIKEGQLIMIPLPSPDTEYILHVAGGKEKVENIAKLYGVKNQELAEINPSLPKKVKQGQTIKIPVKVPEIALPDTLEKEIIKEENIVYDPCTDSLVHKESTYNIALMLPFFLENLDSFDQEILEISKLLDLKSFRFIQMYEGFILAADSMQKAGMFINLFVYDVDNNINKTRKVLQSSELPSMDLIIGPLYSGSFNEVSKFARTFDIKIINPLSKREDVLRNRPYAFKIQPSVESQPEIVSSYLSYSHENSNVILVRHNTYKFTNLTNSLKSEINKQRSMGLYFTNEIISQKISRFISKDKAYCENRVLKPAYIRNNPEDSIYFSNSVKEIIYSTDSLPGLRLNLSFLRENVIIILSEDKVFTHEIMSRLHKLGNKYDITVIGLPEWEQFTELETQHKLNTKLHTLSPSWIDFNAEKTKSFIRKFRTHFGIEPSEEQYAYTGFDIGWYFLNALYRFGRDFDKCLNHFHPDLLHSRYYFSKQNNSGFTNDYWNIIKYEDYKRENAWKH
ncbi:MAG: LysM peptidoglycan-binding domain-containing protein [Bacteroidales bacterium]|nr:LysM peptidoglycan-binding domain-containing protein [Bacteroidales bacterium]